MKPMPRRVNAESMFVTRPFTRIVLPGASFGSYSAMILLISSTTPPRSRPCTLAKTS